MTLLDIVQRTLSLINSQNVLTIDETEESEQVVLIVKNVLDEMHESFPWLSQKERAKLELTATANELDLPTGASAIEWFYYTTSDGVRRKIEYVDPESMVEMFNQRLEAGLSNIDSVGAYNDQDPVYWTTFNNEQIVVDGYNGTLAKNKTDVLAWMNVVYPATGTATLSYIPSRFHSVVMNGVVAEAFRTLKGDDTAAAAYQGKFLRGKIRMRRWHDINQGKGSRFNESYGQTYGRNRVSSARSTPRRIVE